MKLFWAAAALVCGLVVSGAAQARDTEYMYCNVPDYVRGKEYYSPVFEGDYEVSEAYEAGFLAQVKAKHGLGDDAEAYCFFARTRAEAEVELAKDAAGRPRQVIRTQIVPVLARTQDVERSASVAGALILKCKTNDGRSFPGYWEGGATQYLKFADGESLRWVHERGRWEQMPCVRDTRDGQFCSISPAEIWVKESWQPSPGVTMIHNMRINRSAGAFEFSHDMLLSRGGSTYAVVSGTCERSGEPTAPATKF